MAIFNSKYRIRICISKKKLYLHKYYLTAFKQKMIQISQYNNVTILMFRDANPLNYDIYLRLKS